MSFGNKLSITQLIDMIQMDPMVLRRTNLSAI